MDIRKHFKKDTFYQPAPNVKSFCGYGVTNIKKLKILDMGTYYMSVIIEEVNVPGKYDAKSGNVINKGSRFTWYLSNTKQLSSLVECDLSNHNCYSLTF